MKWWPVGTGSLKEPMSRERVDQEQNVPPGQRLLAKIRNLPNDVRGRAQDLASGIVGDIGNGRAQRLNPFSQTLPSQELPLPNASEPSKS